MTDHGEDVVTYSAKLAHLKLSPDDIAEIKPQFEKILALVKTLEKLDTENVAPTKHALPISNVMRDDTVHEFHEKSLLFKNAPKFEQKCYMVPTVIKEA